MSLLPYTGRRRAILAEPDVDLRDRLVESLRAAGFEVTVSTKSALTALLNNSRYAVAVVDYEFAGEAVQSVLSKRRSAANAAVILVSGSKDPETVARTLRLGVSDYFLKQSSDFLPAVTAAAVRAVRRKRQRMTGYWLSLAISLLFVLASGILAYRADTADKTRAKHDAQWLAIVSESHTPILVHDRRGCISAWNHGAAELFGWTEKDVLGANIATLMLRSGLPRCRTSFVDDDQFKELGEKGSVYVNTQLVSSSGRAIPVAMLVSELSNGGVQYVVRLIPNSEIVSKPPDDAPKYAPPAILRCRG